MMCVHTNKQTVEQTQARSEGHVLLLLLVVNAVVYWQPRTPFVRSHCWQLQDDRCCRALRKGAKVEAKRITELGISFFGQMSCHVLSCPFVCPVVSFFFKKDTAVSRYCIELFH